MIKIHLILAVLWIIYCFFHSFLANGHVKSRVTGSLKISNATYRILYNLFALGTLGWLLYVHANINSPEIFHSNMFIKIVAGIFIVGGLSIMLACIAKYFKQLSGLFKESSQSHLQTGGMHQWVRHPLYSGTFLFLIGLALLWPLYSNALAVFVLIAYTVGGTLLEEQKLLVEYGNEYRIYKRRVPMLFPRVSKNRKQPVLPR